MTSKKKTRDELEATIRPKVAAEERAYRWVERLAMVENITEKELKNMMSEINACHYHDVTEERAISKVCGYPLCCVKLEKRTPQKYHITKQNKVIDMSERGLFCSSYCFKASKYVESQIPEEPLWLRDQEIVVTLKLLPKEEASKQKGLGEVPIGVEKLNLDDIEIDEEKADIDSGSSSASSSSSSSSSEDEVEEKERPTKCNKNVKVNTTNNTTETTNETNKCGKSKLKVFDRLKQKSTQANPSQVKFIDSSEVKKVSASKHATYICTTHLLGILKEWFTKETYDRLSKLSENCNDSDDSADEEPAQENCISNPGRFQMNVMNFLSNNPEWVTESNDRKGVNKKLNIDNSSSGENENNKNKSHGLPTIDSKSQNTIRRKIVHEKIYSSLNEILPVCGLLDADLTLVGFFPLIDTFNFSSKNIILNTRQWLLVVIVLLKIISLVYKKSFGDIKKRDDEIKNFLSLRNILPNTEQLKEIVDDIVSNLNNHCNSDNSQNSVAKEFGGIVVGENVCKYDDMEELD